MASPSSEDQSSPSIQPHVAMVIPEALTPANTLVSELSELSEKQLADQLPNIDITFTCKVCRVKKPSLKDLLQHLQEKKCSKGESGEAKRGRGRPRKKPLPENAELPAVKTAKVFYVKKPPQPTAVEVFETPGRRTTRIGTGSIKRRNIADMLGIAIKKEPDDEYWNDDDYITPSKRKAEPAQPGNKVDKRIKIARSETTTTSVSNQARGMDDLLKKVDSAEIGGDADKNVQGDKKAAKDLTKIAFLPVSPEKVVAGSPKKISIKAENARGNIVIPTKSGSGDMRSVVIPHSLLVEALKNHKEKNADSKTIVLIKSEEGTMSIKKTLESQKSDSGEEEGENAQEENDQEEEVIESVLVKPDPDDSLLDAAMEDDEDEDEDFILPNNNSKVAHASRVHTKRLRPKNKVIRPFRCDVCLLRYFATDCELQVHHSCHVYSKEEVLAVDKEKAENDSMRDCFKCPACDFEGKSWHRVLYHLLSHETYRERLANAESVKNIYGSFTCPVCKKNFLKKSNMVGHLKRVHYKTVKTCDVCKVTMEGIDEKTFQRHVEKCRNVDMQCPECPYHSPVSVNMRRHMRVHTDEALHCEHCLKVFPTRQRLMVHLQKHQDDRRRFPCEECGQLFLSHDAAKKHFARFHVVNEQDFPCSKCKYIAKLESDLTKHDKLVHDKKFKCEIDMCPFQTNSLVVYQQHQEYHEPDRIYGCPYTNCYFRSATNKCLSEHCATVHNVYSKHQCPICQKFYKRKIHLLRHLVSHTGDKPYTCMECGMTFFSHSTYYRHRNKTGHDSKREGIASVPQNIVITYMQDDKAVDSRDQLGEGDERRQSAEEEAASLEKLLLQAQEVYATDTDPNIQQDIAAIQSIDDSKDPKEHILYIDPSAEPQVVEEIPFQGQIMGDGTIETKYHIPAGHLALTSEVEIGEDGKVQVMHQDGEILENIIALPEGMDEQQYTYVLSNDPTNLLGTSHVTISGGDEVNLAEDVLSQIYQEGGTGSVETVVEVEAPGEGGNGQYAILLVPSSGDEPEAALSMLQLQSSQ